VPNEGRHRSCVSSIDAPRASAHPMALGKQLLRSGTSVGAHYREAIRARSNAEFISKLEVGMQELEESSYWLELLIEAHIFLPEKLTRLITEADELMAILTTCVKKVKAEGRRVKDEGRRLKYERSPQ
jgi:four helix bundle protein